MTIQKCAHCGAFDMIAGQDHSQCLICGKHTHAKGHKSVPPLLLRTPEGELDGRQLTNW